MQTLMLGKTLAAGEIPVTRQREGGYEEGRKKEREGGCVCREKREGETGWENWLWYRAFSKVKGPHLPAISQTDRPNLIWPLLRGYWWICIARVGKKHRMDGVHGGLNWIELRSGCGSLACHVLLACYAGAYHCYRRSLHAPLYV